MKIKKKKKKKKTGLSFLWRTRVIFLHLELMRWGREPGSRLSNAFIDENVGERPLHNFIQGITRYDVGSNVYKNISIMFIMNIMVFPILQIFYYFFFFFHHSYTFFFFIVFIFYLIYFTVFRVAQDGSHISDYLSLRKMLSCLRFVQFLSSALDNNNN